MKSSFFLCSRFPVCQPLPESCSELLPATFLQPPLPMLIPFIERMCSVTGASHAETLWLNYIMYPCRVTFLQTLLRWSYSWETPAGGASTSTSHEDQQSAELRDLLDRRGSVCCGLFATQATIHFTSYKYCTERSRDTQNVCLFGSLPATLQYLHWTVLVVLCC